MGRHAHDVQIARVHAVDATQEGGCGARHHDGSRAGIDQALQDATLPGDGSCGTVWSVETTGLVRHRRSPGPTRRHSAPDSVFVLDRDHSGIRPIQRLGYADVVLANVPSDSMRTSIG